MSSWASIGLQDAACPLMEQLIYFHDHVMLVLILITTLVLFMLASLLWSTLTDRFLLQHHRLETAWILGPAVFLVLIAWPSLKLLYLLDEINSPSLTVKAIGHQWYWSYEYSDFNTIEFDSYMVPTSDLPDSGFRLLDVDNRTVMPMNTQIRVLTTSSDVIHSWTVPSLGVKVDAIPGRLNQLSVFISKPGLFFGQCSEICGANHSFMPIVVESTSTQSFLNWANSFSEEEDY